MKKIILLAVLLLLVLLAVAGPAAANPATLPIKLENPQFGPPCEVPPDLGFEPLFSMSETNTITGPDGEAIGTTAGCQFLKEDWMKGDIYYAQYVSFFTFMLPEGDLELAFTNDLKATDGTSIFKISGTIVDGSGIYDSAGGTVLGGGVWPKDAPLPNVHLVLQIR